MKFFNLLKGELNKILMRPILYVITAVVIIAIIFSYFQFSPHKREDYNAYYASYEKLETLPEVNSKFRSNMAYGKIQADNLINESTNILNKAEQKDKKTEPGQRTITEYLTYLIGDEVSVSETTTFITAYNKYIEPLNSSIDISGNVAPDTEKYALINLIGPLEDLDFHYEIPEEYKDINLTAIYNYFKTLINGDKILIKQQAFDDFENLYKEIKQNIISKDRKYNISKHSDHIAIKKYFEQDLHLKQIVINFCNNTGLKSISEEIYNERAQNIVDAKAYLVELDQEITNLVPSNEPSNLNLMKDLCVKYYLFALNVKNLMLNTEKYQPVMNFSDSQLKEYYGYTSKNSNTEDNIYLYNVKEDISKELYLLNNKKAESEFANVFSSTTSNSSANAFDFVYFGLEITSIVIIIFTVVLAAGMLAGEQSTGTLKLLLIRPYSRSKILTSKLLATIIFASIFLIFSTVILFLIGWALYGVNFTPVLAVFNGTMAFAIHPMLLLLIYLMCILLKAIVFIIISLAISAIFRSNVGAVSISIVLYFLISIMGTIFATSFWYGFLPFSNLDLFKFFGGSFVGNGLSNSLLITLFSSSIFHDVGFFYSLGLNLALILILTFASYLIFRKREVK